MKILQQIISATVLCALLIGPHSFTKAATYKILIDPGHGSSANKRQYEGETELQTGLKLKSELEKKGYQVFMTRSSNGASIGGAKNENADNIARANIANSNNVDLAIRLHSDDRSDEQFWALYPDVQGKDRTGASGPLSSKVIPESKKFAGILTSTMNKSGFSGITKGENTYTAAGKGDILIFSAHSKVPVVTLELYGNKTTALRAKYASSATQLKVAQTIAKAVDEYFGKTSETPQQSQPGQAASSASPKEKSPFCPPEAPNTGPGSGIDYRPQIAQAFEFALNLASSSSESEDDTHGEYSGNLPATNNRIAEIAKGEIGYQGYGPCPRGKLDRTKYYNGGRSCIQWCAAFTTWVIKKAGYDIPTIISSRATLSWFRSNGHSVFTDPAKAGPGDIVVWAREGEHGHIGIVVANDGSTITTVEGNSSRDKVKTQVYSHSSIRTNMRGLIGFGRW